ncbi:MAG: phospholipase [Methyloceanibacter sp.]|uniref:alpha/beta hydrolase n=1 Tax=Methyloceanibacter sp. TaxID=1965321 RepID=UPI001DDC557B|nr:phospholipase [Methyloceanibacter sp.]MCB1442628.1 phospholipase [Methyloceanibacter sp.]MCC0059491.1 phospholipase [Hyphomicrobiaceae bacterium]
MTTPQLDGPRLAPAAGGAPKQLVVFLHGYGADGNDLIGLGREWAPLLPNAAFVSPDAPQPCGMAPMGRQWFDLSLGDMSIVAAGVKKAAPALDSFLDAELERHGLTSESLALVGFSQGTMMALAVGLTRNAKPAAIVGYSGALATVEDLPPPGEAPAILLVHGDMDEVIPVDAMIMAREVLGQAGLSVQWHVSRGIGHGIDGEGLRLGGTFLRDAFARGRSPG